MCRLSCLHYQFLFAICVNNRTKSKSGLEVIRLPEELPFLIILSESNSIVYKICFRLLKKRKALLESLRDCDDELIRFERSQKRKRLTFSETDGNFVTTTHLKCRPEMSSNGEAFGLSPRAERYALSAFLLGLPSSQKNN